MARKIGIADVARAAGVSTATVDRVIHGREGVSQKAAARVLAAIEALDYGKLPEHLRKETLQHYRFAFVLPDRSTDFINDLEAQITHVAGRQAGRKIEPLVLRTDILDEAAMTATLDNLGGCRLDGLAIFALDSAAIKTAIDRLVDNGLPVCTIVSDVPNSHRFAFIGQDSVVSGRTAARLLGLHAKASGKVVIVTGPHMIHDQSYRVFGFKDVLSRSYPNLEILDILEGKSNSALNHARLTELFNKHPDIVGLYGAGAGRSGVISAIRTLPPERRPACVLHELNNTTKEALAAGLLSAVIHQDRTNIIEQAIQALCGQAHGRPWKERALPSHVFMVENMP